ncbi:MAG: tetratricopeptide repeat protein [candidate division Zixibacteria bacterium]|nr:tetratricopeptide repeat protein [candidate division Zixibacteria bacterium]
MPRSSISNSDIIHLLRRAGLFVVGLVLIYPATIFVMSHTPAPDFNDYQYEYNLYQFVTHNYTLPGGFGYTLNRYREIEEYQDIDILFLGSSRCYYSFAPHVFKRLGLTTFNMGTPSQTPLNTKYLLKRYFDQLNPKLTVFEVNLHTLAKDGVESFYDLMINTPMAWETAQMALATQHPHAVNAVVSRALSSITTPHDKFEMQDRPMDAYLPGGAVVAKNFNQEHFSEQPADVHIPDVQLEYLDDIIRMVRERGSELILVVAPVPKEWQPIITNYTEITTKIKNLAAGHGVRFYDFNQAMTLDSRTDFKDFHHLNGNGAKIFSYDILDSLLDVPDYRRALKVDPLLAAEVYAGRGIAFADKGDYGRAIDDYHKALALSPESGMVQFNRARACQKVGRIAEAIAAYREFIKFAPEQYTQYIEPVKAQIAALEGSQSIGLTDHPGRKGS